MIELARTVRFCVNFDPRWDAQAHHQRHNTFAGWPSMHGLGAFYEIDVICLGQADPLTGYMMNISVIDRAARQHAIPVIQRAVRDRAISNPAEVLRETLRALQPALNQSVVCMRWRLTPYYALAMNTHTPDRVLISQQFEFSAAHRLDAPSLGAERNREIFGKCNNPNGHGHNYRIEVSVSLALDSDRAKQLDLPMLEEIVDRTIIQRFDHKHLNLDTAEFATLNPSVEHIAKVCYELLREPIENAGGTLEWITIWETEKTKCRYPAVRALI